MDDLSAHADADAVLSWSRTAPEPPRACCVVHGEPGPAAALAARTGHTGHAAVDQPVAVWPMR